MKLIELVTFNAELLQKLQQAGVKIDDYQHVAMYNDYEQMLQEGHKKTYILLVLSDRYHLSPRTIHDILKHLCQDCNPPASV